MSEIKKVLELNGFSSEEAEKTFNRWYGFFVQAILYRPDISKHLVLEDSPYNDHILVEGIDVAIVCPHHLMPVELMITVDYIPDGKVLGLSKFVRIARQLAHAIKQEDYTILLLNKLREGIKPKEIRVEIDGVHSCMRCRGTYARYSKTKTSQQWTMEYLYEPEV